MTTMMRERREKGNNEYKRGERNMMTTRERRE